MKKNKLLLSSAILGTIYLFFLVSHFIGGTLTSENLSDTLAGSIATFIIAPHMVLIVLSVIFNWIGWAANLIWAALVAGILYSVSILAMPLYFPFVILQLTFSFIAFSKMKQLKILNNKKS